MLVIQIGEIGHLTFDSFCKEKMCDVGCVKKLQLNVFLGFYPHTQNLKGPCTAPKKSNTRSVAFL